jgi:hypothetical protein
METQILQNILPRRELPLRAKATFPVLDDLNDSVDLVPKIVSELQPKDPPRVRATVVVYSQRPLETLLNQTVGFHISLDLLSIEERFEFIRRHPLGRADEYFLVTEKSFFRRVDWSEFVPEMNRVFVRAGLRMRIEAFLDRCLPLGLAAARWESTE